MAIKIIPSDKRNRDGSYGECAVRGIATNKQFIETKASLDGVNLTSYKLVQPGSFAFVADTSRRGDKMSLAFNNTQKTFIVSPISSVFELEKNGDLLPEYLYLWFLRPEFDRYARFHSWGSARETFTLDDMMRAEIPLPEMEIQRQVVDVWEGLHAMKQDNEAQAEPLMSLCMCYLEKLRKEYPHAPIGDYIIPVDERNTEGVYGEEHVRGVSKDKVIIPTKANLEGVSIATYKLLKPDEFAYVTVTSRNGGKISLAQNDSTEVCLVSSTYEVFRVISDALIPQYLYLWFLRPEFDRYARFHSWGSARETFGMDDMKRVRIPIPPIEKQRAIVDIYRCARESKEIAAAAGELCRRVTPALIRKAEHARERRSG